MFFDARVDDHICQGSGTGPAFPRPIPLPCAFFMSALRAVSEAADRLLGNFFTVDSSLVRKNSGNGHLSMASRKGCGRVSSNLRSRRILHKLPGQHHIAEGNDAFKDVVFANDGQCAEAIVVEHLDRSRHSVLFAKRYDIRDHDVPQMIVRIRLQKLLDINNA